MIVLTDSEKKIFEDVKRLIKNTYDGFWQILYKADPNQSKAKLIISVANTDSGYCISSDTIYINIFEGNLSDHDIKNADLWPIWKEDLVHEMIHELQHKRKHFDSLIGKSLHDKYTPFYKDKGHGLDFFSALVFFAEKIEMDSNQLASMLVCSPFS